MATRPELPYGYEICNYTPANVASTGGSTGVLEMSFPYWTVKEYVGEDDDFLYYKFTANDGSDTFWAWPVEVACSSSGSSKAPTTSSTALKVKQVQQKLNYYYKDPPNYPLVVDGSWGPKTCGAAYGYQNTAVGYSGSNLIGQFFVKLGLPEVWTTTFKNSCASWYQDIPPAPSPEPPPGPVEPSAPFPWKEMLIGAAGGSLIGLAGKKTVLKKSAVKTWQAGLGGALLGALGGFVAGKMRA